MLLAFWIFQSTRPHGGATEHEPPVCCGRIISIHAPAWGRDQVTAPGGLWETSFQSTRPHGGATRRESAHRRLLAISIHAPAWGRDRLAALVFAILYDFNPRARMGARRPPTVISQTTTNFNPRARMGARPSPPRLLLRSLDFNPRARMGARRRGFRRCQGLWQFQSTRPHGGATQLGKLVQPHEVISIHAPAWGRDGFARLSARNDDISIHAPAWGRDRRVHGRFFR